MDLKPIRLKPVEMTKEIMLDLENRKLIYRLCPNHDELSPGVGETHAKAIYECADKYGPHKLITVTVNRSELAGFGTHDDIEDFLLIGDPSTKPMYLVIALCMKDELEDKIEKGTVSEKDFVALKVKYNDPEVSFFSMLRNVPHGEAAAEGEGRPASFYVTESRDLGLDVTDFKGFKLKVSE